MFAIRGGIHPLDAYCISALLRFQTVNKMAGGVVEIGVGEGRSFFLLASSVQEGERAFAVDIFVDEPRSNGESRKLQLFRETAKKVGISLPSECVYVGRSESVSPDLLNAVGEARFFSIDGGHSAIEVATDARLADSILADHGVVAFDDFGNPEWPEVAVAAIDFLRQNQNRYSAFAITRGKLYVCRNEFHARYREALTSARMLRRFPKREVDFLGSRAIWVHQSVTSRILSQAFLRIGMGRIVSPQGF
jgi:hypothetical protein